MGRKLEKYTGIREYLSGYYIYDQGDEVQNDVIEDEGDFGVYDSQEVEALLEGSTNISARKPSWRKGGFIFLMPWWEVAVYLKEPTGGSYREMAQPPEYSIRSDALLDQRGENGSVFYQFLNECGIKDHEIKTNFLQYLRSLAHERDTGLDFTLLCEVIRESGMIEDEAKQTLVCHVKKDLVISELYKIILKALECPTLLHTLPKILPKHLQFLMSKKVAFQKCVTLETILKEEPWRFGFSNAIKEKTNLQLPEVGVDKFKEAGLFDKIRTQYMQNALLVYCLLKEKCDMYRNTFSWLRKPKGLKSHFQYKYEQRNRSIDWAAVWKFLKEQRAVYYENSVVRYHHVEEENDKKKTNLPPAKQDRVYLYKYWQAEDTIARCIHKLQEYDDDTLGDDDEDEEGGDEDATTKTENTRCKEEEIVSGNHLVMKSVDDDDGDDFVDPLPMPDCSANIVEADTAGDTMSRNEQKKDLLDPKQQAAAKCIREKPFSLIMGKGGCGKTHVACTVLQEFQNTQIVMAAPTGKAASNLAKRCRAYPNIIAKTLAQVRFQYASAKSRNKLHEWEFKDAEVLVVDECSMVSVIELSQVLRAMMEYGRLNKLVLMGDYRQLPSVDSGNLLEDLYLYFKDSDVYVELTKNWRTSPASRLISENATAISLQQMPECPVDSSFQMIPPPKAMRGKTDIDRKRKRLINKLYKDEVSVKDHKRSQIVTFKRNDVLALNGTCCPIYSKHEMKVNYKFIFEKGDKICPTKNAYITDIEMKAEWDRRKKEREEQEKKQKEEEEKRRMEEEVKRQKREEKRRRKEEKQRNKEHKKKKKKKVKKKKKKSKHDDDVPDEPFVDPVMVEADKDEEDITLIPYMKRICNGEIFYITKISRDRVDVTITDLDRTFTVAMKELQELCHIRHAWARTIHTYQGSETETVIYWIDQPSFQNWKHVYTAVTRGKNKVYIVGTKEDLHTVIKTHHPYRFTALRDMLETEMGFNTTRRVQPGDMPGARQAERSRSTRTPQSVVMSARYENKRPGSTGQMNVEARPQGNLLSKSKLTPIKYAPAFKRFIPGNNPVQCENAQELTGASKALSSGRASTSKTLSDDRASTSKALSDNRASTSKRLSDNRASTSKALSDGRTPTSKALSHDNASNSNAQLVDTPCNTNPLVFRGIEPVLKRPVHIERAQNVNLGQADISQVPLRPSNALSTDQAFNSKSLSNDRTSNSIALSSGKASMSKALFDDSVFNSNPHLADKPHNNTAMAFRGIEPVLKRPVHIERAQNVNLGHADISKEPIKPSLQKSVEILTAIKSFNGKTEDESSSNLSRFSEDSATAQTTDDIMSNKLTYANEVKKEQKRNKLSRNQNKKAYAMKRALLDGTQSFVSGDQQTMPNEINSITSIPYKKPKIAGSEINTKYPTLQNPQMLPLYRMISPASSPNVVDKAKELSISTSYLDSEHTYAASEIPPIRPPVAQPMSCPTQEYHERQSLNTPLKMIQPTSTLVSSPSPNKPTEISNSNEKKEYTFSAKALHKHRKRENSNKEDVVPSKKTLFN